MAGHEQVTRRVVRRQRRYADPDATGTPAMPVKMQQTLAQNLNRLPAGNRPDVVMNMQRQFGNASTLRLMRGQTTPGIQRAGVPSSYVSGSEAAWYPAKTIWKVPFGYGDAKTKGDAIHKLDDISAMLTELMEHMPKNERGAFEEGKVLIQRHMRQLMEGISSEIGASILGSDLSNEDILRLESLSVQLNKVASKAVGRVSSTTHAALGKIEESTSRLDLADVQNQLREQIQVNFMLNKTNPDVVEKMRKTLLKTFLIQVKVAKVAGWARDLRDLNDDLNSMVNLGSSLDKSFIKPDRSGSLATVFKSWMNKGRDGVLRMLQVAEAWHGLTTIFGHRTDDLPDTMQFIEQFKARLDLIDAGMPFFEMVPMLGDLWFDIYSTFTRKVIEKIQILYELKLRENINMVTSEMTGRDRNARGVPYLTAEARQLYPGGQPVYDFMYAVVNDDEPGVADPEVTPQIVAFFQRFRNRFNIGLTKQEKLPVKSASHWYNPKSWGDESVDAEHLLYWVKENKEIIWAQLYGNLEQRG